MSDMRVISIPVDDLILNDVRQERGSSFQDLVQSIGEIGLLHPVVVVEGGTSDDVKKYKIVGGRRRVLAVKELGWTHVPAIVQEMDGVVMEMATISENIHRLDLGADRDGAIARYAELHEIRHPTAARDAEIRRSVGMGWDVKETPQEVQEALERPAVPSPVAAAAKAFGVTQGTITRAIRRAKGFTPSQRKVLDDAKIAKADLDILAAESEPIVAEVTNLIAAGYEFGDAMNDVLKSDGRTYTGRDGSLEEMESRLARLPARRGIGDPEAFDNDCKLFWAIEDAVKEFKKKIDWTYKREVAGKNPHGLYYRRLELFLEAKNPRHWVPCRCQKTGDDRWNCAYCRSGAYQIGE